MIENILQKLYTIEHIPSYPQVKRAVNNLLGELDLDNNADIDRLALLLSYDPSMAIELLRIANAESFGYNNKISSIKHALLVLDNDLIRLIIDQHPEIPDLVMFQSGIEEKVGQLVLHSIEVHIIVQQIIDGFLGNVIKDPIYREELLTAATLHDIGLFFLLVYFPEKYIEILDRIEEKSSFEKGKEIFTLPDHSLVSSMLCQYWNLPPIIRDAIAFHHYPWDGPGRYNIGAQLLYLADGISASYYNLFHRDDLYTMDERIIMRRELIDMTENFGITMTDIVGIQMKTIASAGEIYSDFGF